MADRPTTEPRTDHTTRYLYQCPGCWGYGLWAIPIGGGRSKTDEGWIECECGERMTRIDLRRQEPSPLAEAAQGAAPRAEGLDVDQFREWVIGIVSGYPMDDGEPLGLGGRAFEQCRMRVLDLLDEWQSRPSDERVPESEEPR